MTSIRQLIEKLLDNWIPKVVSLGIAILLYIFYQTSQIDKKTFVVPLKIQENGIVMHVGNAPNSVPVVIRTTESNMNMITASDFTAVVNLDSVTDSGIHTLPIHITLSDKLMEMDPLEVILKDDSIVINTDLRVSKYVPIIPSVVGDVAHGYKVGSVSISPSTVQISGPETVINAIDSVQSTKITVSNAEKNFSVETGLLEISSIVNIKNEGPYTATVLLEAETAQSDFTVPVEIVNLDSSLVLKSSLPAVTLTLSGEMNALEKFKPGVRIAVVNMRDIVEEGAYEVAVRYNVPSSFTLVAVSDDTLTVIVEKLPEEPAEEGEPGEDAQTGEESVQ